MLLTILLILFLLWFIGIVRFPGLSISPLVIMYFNGKAITIIEVLIFFVIIWALSILPPPIKQIAGVIFLLWILSVLGIITIVGLPSVLVIAIIIGLVVALFGRYLGL